MAVVMEIMDRQPAVHIHLDERGVAWIDNTNTKVIEVVCEHVDCGLSPEQIQTEHPHLTVGQIFAALGYYYDHQQLIDAEIRRWDDLAELVLSKNPQPTREFFTDRLRQNTERAAS